MIKISICDDNNIELEKAACIVHKWASKANNEVNIMTFDNGDSLLDNQKIEPADIILLDIMMPLLNGMETAKELRESKSNAKIIFLTSSPEFAVESYDVKASGYLLKPVSEEKLIALLEDCTDSVNTEPDNIIVKTVTGYQKLYIQKIECVEAHNRKVAITLIDGTVVESSDTFTNVTEFIDEKYGFFKCHRSYIVSMDSVDKFNSVEIVTKSGKHIPIARGFAKPFKDAYFAYMFKKGKG